MKGIVVLLVLMVLASNAYAMRNPAAVYCDALGYQYVVEKSVAGETGYCRLPNNRTVEAWAFLQGKKAADMSYCAVHNMTLRVVEDPVKCRRLMVESCAVCVTYDGTEKEVTEAMGLSLADTVCGDGSCGFPEDSSTCPKDCLHTATTLPQKKPLETPQDRGCIPLLLAPVSLLAAAASKLIKV